MDNNTLTEWSIFSVVLLHYTHFASSENSKILNQDTGSNDNGVKIKFTTKLLKYRLYSK